jgi:hypothetical protein
LKQTVVRELKTYLNSNYELMHYCPYKINTHFLAVAVTVTSLIKVKLAQRHAYDGTVRRRGIATTHY